MLKAMAELVSVADAGSAGSQEDRGSVGKGGCALSLLRGSSYKLEKAKVARFVPCFHSDRIQSFRLAGFPLLSLSPLLRINSRLMMMEGRRTMLHTGVRSLPFSLRWPNVLLLACLSKASEDNAPPPAPALVCSSVNAFKPSNTVEHFPP